MRGSTYGIASTNGGFENVRGCTDGGSEEAGGCTDGKFKEGVVLMVGLKK